MRFVEVVLATEFEVTKSSTLERASQELWRNSWYEPFLSSTREKSGAAAGSNLAFFIWLCYGSFCSGLHVGSYMTRSQGNVRGESK